MRTGEPVFPNRMSARLPCRVVPLPGHTGHSPRGMSRVWIPIMAILHVASQIPIMAILHVASQTCDVTDRGVRSSRRLLQCLSRA